MPLPQAEPQNNHEESSESSGSSGSSDICLIQGIRDIIQYDVVFTLNSMKDLIKLKYTKDSDFYKRIVRIYSKIDIFCQMLQSEYIIKRHISIMTLIDKIKQEIIQTIDVCNEDLSFHDFEFYNLTIDLLKFTVEKIDELEQNISSLLNLN